MEHGSQAQVPFMERVACGVTCYQDFNNSVKRPYTLNDKMVIVNLEFHWSVGVSKKISLSRKNGIVY